MKIKHNLIFKHTNDALILDDWNVLNYSRYIRLPTTSCYTRISRYIFTHAHKVSLSDVIKRALRISRSIKYRNKRISYKVILFIAYSCVKQELLNLGLPPVVQTYFDPYVLMTASRVVLITYYAAADLTG